MTHQLCVRGTYRYLLINLYASVHLLLLKNYRPRHHNQITTDDAATSPIKPLPLSISINQPVVVLFGADVWIVGVAIGKSHFTYCSSSAVKA